MHEICVHQSRLFPLLNLIILEKSKLKALTHYHTMTPFDAPGIARNEQFLLFPPCFLPIWIILCHFRQI